MMIKPLAVTALLATLGAFVTGCNAGVAPAGASQEEMRATFDKQPVDERAKMLLEAPGPLDAQKISKIRDMYQKEGKPIPADVEKKIGGGGQASAH